ncbi:MAG: acylphosphatase [Lysobacteraceae bacterium]|nr:MAG: acylphosphatase [Xanthomonadaceae bacterium]
MSAAEARFLISGRVQGVAFRAYARQRALALGLRGYARNLDDGRVEVFAAGAADAIDRLESWLHRGSPMARVDMVLRELAGREAQACTPARLDHVADDFIIC